MPIRIDDDLIDLNLTAGLMKGPEAIHPALILDAARGPILVDTGVPGLLEQIKAALLTSGFPLTDVKTVLITHHDYDHIGSLPEIIEATNAQVLAATSEIPYIQDGKRAQKPPPLEHVEAALQTFPEGARAYFRAMWTHVQPPVPVTRALSDNEVLNFAGGIRVIFTPGHTVGHTSFFLERTRVLLAGDALMVINGTLTGPLDMATPDKTSANTSVRRLAALEPSAILCFHGGLVHEDAAGQLHRLAMAL